MSAAAAPLLAAGIPRALFFAWSAVVVACCVVSHLQIMRRYRRLLNDTEAELQRLEQRLDEYQQKVDAEVAQMRAEVDAYGTWSDANDRFFHHGLVAVSHMIGARALPTRRACATERRSTQERRTREATWRPKPTRAANRATSVHPALHVPRRTCQQPPASRAKLD